MKIDQRQLQESATEDATTGEIERAPSFYRPRAEEAAEAELQKLFLARLDVHSRIEEIKRNRASLRARKVDVEGKIASLSEFQSKLMQREEALSRSIAES